MSKSSLKKELMSLSHDQLVEVILDSYSANPEFKEYYEFFLNPDVDALLDKHKKLISKEMNRTKYGYSKMRVTVIKNAVKKFIGFNPGPVAVSKMLFKTLDLLGVTERFYHLIDSHYNYVNVLVDQIIKHSNANNMGEQTILSLNARVDAADTFTPYFRERIRMAVTSAIQNLG